MKIIGLTGIFGSGKSTVAGFLGDMGAAVIDADKIVHQFYLPGADGLRRVIDLFGTDVLDADGCLNRHKLADIVFADKAARARLNAAIHPLVTRHVKALLAEHRRHHIPVVVIEAPLLIEAGWVSIVNEVWVTTAPRAVIFQRLNRKYGLSSSSVLARINAQIPVKEQIRHAAQIINTDTSHERLKAAVLRLWQKVI